MSAAEYGRMRPGPALILMEVAASLPIVAALTRTGDSVFGLVVGLAFLPMGFLAAQYVVPLASSGRRFIAGFVLAYVVRLALNPLTAPAQDVAPAAAVIGWLIMALLPTMAYLGLWWRGGYLAESDFSAVEIRREFVLLGGLLFLQLWLLGQFGNLFGFLPVLSVGLYVVSGLSIMGTSRQDAAGAETRAASRVLVLGTVVTFFAIGAFVVAMLRPSMLEGLWVALGVVGSVLYIVAIWVLEPLFWLLTKVEVPYLAQVLANIGELTGPRREGEQAQLGQLPEWIQWLAYIGMGLFAILLLAVILTVIYEFLAQVKRKERGGRDPVGIESLDGWGELRHALGSWLSGAVKGVVPHLSLHLGEPPIHDARAAYRALLGWAKQEGIERAPAETTQQLRGRLEEELPFGAERYGRLTDAYERERYGGAAASPDQLGDLVVALRELKELAKAQPSKQQQAAPGA